MNDKLNGPNRDQQSAEFEIDRRPEVLATASRDFGHLVAGRAEGVTCVRDEAELLSLVRHANHMGLSLTPSGTRGSCGGQSLPNGGIALDMTKMTDIGPVDPSLRTIECAPGATLRQITEATLPHGLLPNVLSFNLDLTLGGILSAGGFGANCHRFGPVIANVLSVVTGDGRPLRCSREEHSDLFDAALGGLGRCAVISRATLSLRSVEPKVRIWSLIHHDQGEWLAAQESLRAPGRCDHLQAFLWAGPQVLRATPNGFFPKQTWSYGISVGREYSGAAPETDRMLSGLKPSAVLAIDDADTTQFIDLYRDRFEQMRRTRAWSRRHPWIDCLLTPEMLRAALPRVLEMLPREAGDGHRVAWIPTRDLPRLFAVPPGEWVAILAILPTSVDETAYEETAAALDRVRRMLWDLGGKAYLANWFGPLDDAGWRRHFGGKYEAWIAAKQKYDPRRVLHSMAFSS